MTLHTAQYVNERQSDLRGIKDGWYAMSADGALAFGPFCNRESCLSRIFQFAPGRSVTAKRYSPRET